MAQILFAEQIRRYQSDKEYVPVSFDVETEIPTNSSNIYVVVLPGMPEDGDDLLNIFSSGQISRTRRKVIQELMQASAEEETIKSIICPELTETEAQEKKGMWMEMWGK